ncbi:MAG: DNA translocase FtsK, partial [Eubacterium sp.]|nr:DNA translocase FtsK [Eubacterium sp.]
VAGAKNDAGGGPGNSGSDQDELFAEAGFFIIDKDNASIGRLQRMFRIGFNRAARIMDQLADAGVVSEDAGTKAREILMSREQFENYLEENG